MARSKIVLLGACCLVFVVLTYSALQLKLTHPNGEAKRSAEAYGKKSQERLFQSVRANETLKPVYQSPNATTREASRATESTASADSKAASESFIKLQYALNSTDANLEEPHLFSMGRYVNTFTTYLEAILSDKSIDRKPFHSLRRQFFPWWFPSAGTAYLPWKPPGTPKSGIVLTVGKGPQLIAVPEVTEKSQADASSAIKSAGLTVGDVTKKYNDSVALGQVISSSPKSGTKIAPDRPVDLVISRGVQQVTLDNYVGQNIDAVSQALNGKVKINQQPLAYVDGGPAP